MKYKLVKKYPGSPDINTEVEYSWLANGYIIKKKEYGKLLFKEDVENNPEFWQKIEEPLFKVGDIFQWQDGTNLRINILEIKEKYVKYQYINNPMKKFAEHYIDALNEHIESKKLIKLEKIHTTEDGVDIYSNCHPELFWVKFSDFTIGIDAENSLFKDSNWNIDTVNYKYFSTKELAEKYIYDNQKVYSRNDLRTKLNGLIFCDKISLNALLEI